MRWFPVFVVCALAAGQSAGADTLGLNQWRTNRTLVRILNESQGKQVEEKPMTEIEKSAAAAVSRWDWDRKAFPSLSVTKTKAKAEARKLGLKGDDFKEFVDAFCTETLHMRQRLAFGQ